MDAYHFFDAKSNGRSKNIGVMSEKWQDTAMLGQSALVLCHIANGRSQQSEQMVSHRTMVGHRANGKSKQVVHRRALV